MKKSTHRGFRGPNNFLLARPIFSSRNRTSFFRRRIDRCRCLDRSRCSKTIENVRKNHSVCYMSAIFRLFSSIVRFRVSFLTFSSISLHGFPAILFTAIRFFFILLSFLPSSFSSLLPFLSFSFPSSTLGTSLNAR